MTDDYSRYLEQGMEPVVRQILSYYSYDNWNPVSIAAALHHYTYNKIDYVARGSSPNRREFRAPRECWKAGGNCEEQSVLLSSLFGSVKTLRSRLTAVRSPKDDVAGHLLVLAGVTGELANTEFIKDFYRSTPEVDETVLDSCFSEKRGSDRWFVADPEMSSYLGDASSLKGKGYIQVSDEAWDWHDATVRNVV